MGKIVEFLDKDLEYMSHEIIDGVMYIQVRSRLEQAICPYCGTAASKVHSRYQRKFQDLPIQGKKVVILMDIRKMFCGNHDCAHKTFAESFDFIAPLAKKTKRLEEEILNISLRCSSITAAEVLSRNIVSIGKSTVSRIIKKHRAES